MSRQVDMATPTSIDAYLDTLPPDRRRAMEQIRAAIQRAAPEATETIAYKMPAFRSHGGQFLISFDAYKRHYSLFPASQVVVEALGRELAPYLSGKGTLRFPADRPIPEALVARVAEIRFREVAARAADEG
jgi:uncharacterized protein YdhG (YjbR/CyaY superfamily)